jgi:hypothetical protein
MPVQLDSMEYWKSLTDSIHLLAAKERTLPPLEGQENRAAAMEKAILIDHRPLFNFSYHAPWFDWSSRNTTNIFQAPAATKKEEEKEKKEKEARTATIVGLVVGIIAAGVTGYLWTSFWDARTVTNTTGEILRTLNSLQAEEGPIWEDLRVLVSAKHDVDERNYAKARAYLFSSATLLVGAGCAVIGGIKVVSTLIRIGYITMAIGGFAFLFSIGAHWKDNEKNQEMYTRITGYTYRTPSGDKTVEGLAEKVQRQFPQYDGSMKKNSDRPPPAYQAVFGYIQVDQPPPPYNPASEST